MNTALRLLVALVALGGPVWAAPVQSRPHKPGDLARDRMQGMESLMVPSEQVIVARPGQNGTFLPVAQAKTVRARLAELVSDDNLYVGDAQYERPQDCYALTVGEGLQSATVLIHRDKPSLTLMRMDGNRMVNADYLPVLPKVVRLLQAMYPDAHGLSAFHPLPLSVPKASGIPASALVRIATLTPRQTRFDVQRLFTTEGGLSSTYWNHYVYKDYGLSTLDRRDGLAVVPGGLIKVNIDFAPRDADVVWLHGRGFWLHQSDYHAHSVPNHFQGEPDDTILRVSDPYVQQEVFD